MQDKPTVEDLRELRKLLDGPPPREMIYATEGKVYHYRQDLGTEVIGTIDADGNVRDAKGTTGDK